MLKQALKRSSQLRAAVTYVCKVPGSYDMPLVVQALLEKDDVDAVVTLGAIVRGKTKHDEVIAHVLANKIADLGLQHNKPVALGVAGPGMTWGEAEARTNEYANRSVNAAVKMTIRQRQIRRKARSYPVVVE
jgi:6,7-dimethyl-8-ribityllumazine synthase